ncbi:hypothetical protein BGZ61DRAFT_455032 [Ilyonectria robusta]|uniref:uncharacterized protein n=1 Tax=Ilyonectria robusta TaxID=1079257 RepID=UPI001E8E7E96|nr:uncharacterized protein BGZ61DRAFT_455032 [Ilyonectria robusta]KAH8685179.1 hypothetical protein BGZ61DRAFT_455032 [Ilyonectria robusta]
MSYSFHRFLDLPWELREMIWKYAIRPARPGVQVFSVYNYDEEKNDTNTMNDVGLNPTRNTYIRLSAPKWGPRSIGDKFRDPKVTASWTHNNPSTCLTDGGLWTACEESRLIIKSEFQSLEWKTAWKPHCSGWRDFYNRDKPISVTSYYKGEESLENHYFTIFPNHDLFYLQPHNLRTLDWSQIAFDLSLGPYWLGGEGMDNVALEFDPNWVLEVEKAGPDDREIEIVDVLATAAIEGADEGHICTIWLIDYGIKRNPEAPLPAERGLDATFHQGDRRFVDVRSPRSHSETPAWNEYYELDGCSISCRSFIRQIELEIESRGYRQNLNGTDQSLERIAEFRVLACEYN